VDFLSAKALLLRKLHHGPGPLILANIWDAAGARLVEQAGFPAVATSSGAIAASLGYADNDSMPLEAVFGAVERIAASVDVPVTADLEGGYELGASEFVERLRATGAVGCNLEDSDHHGDGELLDSEAHAFRLAAIKEVGREAGFDLVINARVDTFLFKEQSPAALEEAVTRALLYLEAGADCVYPIRLTDEGLIGEFVQRVQAPVNIWARHDAPSLERLAELGVARVSHAGDLMRRSYTTLEKGLAEIRDALA
jgi:2-methylisocitrate lyase-like PEP mutase family enzyme